MRDCQNKANRKRTPRQELNKPEDKAEDQITKLRPEAQSNLPPPKKPPTTTKEPEPITYTLNLRILKKTQYQDKFCLLIFIDYCLRIRFSFYPQASCCA